MQEIDNTPWERAHLREQDEKLPTMEVKYQKRAAAAVKCNTKISVGRCQPNVPLDLSDVLCEKMVILCMKWELADVWFIKASTTLLSYQKKHQWETRRAAANLEKMVGVVGSGSCSSMETSVTRSPCSKYVGGAETVASEPRFGNGKPWFLTIAKSCVVGRGLIASVREYSDGGGLAVSHVRWFSAESTNNSLRTFPQANFRKWHSHCKRSRLFGQALSGRRCSWWYWEFVCSGLVWSLAFF